jgi:lipoate-protein ligase A
MRWRFLVTPADDGPSNMALDEALTRRAAVTGDATFRIYGWSRPTLSIGRNQRARGCYDEDEARRLGVEFVRRPTGGRALLHDHEITYSVTLPMRDGRTPRAAYHFINCVLLAGLERLGVQARKAVGSVSLSPGLRPCFDVPSEHEIEVDGRKLVGSAQWRHAGVLLQHGSILVRDDQAIIARLVKQPLVSMTRAATLVDALGWEPTVADVAPAMLASLGAEVGSPVESFELDAAPSTDAAALRDVYADESWTWRR